ncbi:MAG: M15 family metallopeptidase [Treponema sp.]|nr:M15 family metallopeptidase [Treponema sp.]
MAEKINDNLDLEIDSSFYVSEISDELFAKMWGKSFKENCTVPRSQLSYLHLLHKTLEGESREGELVCNVKIADILLEIFKELYRAGYPIEKIHLIDEYNADDETSMRDNNSSCFNFRFISHTKVVSKHGAGLAVDINPLYNPYYKKVGGKTVIEPATGEIFLDRSKDFPYKIDHNDLAYKLFTKAGFEWGGDWSDRKDWQHFEWIEKD